MNSNGRKREEAGRGDKDQLFFPLHSPRQRHPHTLWMLLPRSSFFSPIRYARMASSNAVLLPQPAIEPPVHRGMQELDRAKFTQRLDLLAARLPAAKTTQFLKQDGKECAPVHTSPDVRLADLTPSIC